MLPAYISHPDCAKHEMGSMHPESPDRIGAIHDMLLIKGLLDCMQTYDAPLATEQQLAQAHSMLYIHTIANMAPAEGYVRVDPDTCMNPYTYPAVLRAAGGGSTGDRPGDRARSQLRVLQHTSTRAPCGICSGGGILFFQQCRRGYPACAECARTCPRGPD